MGQVSGFGCEHLQEDPRDIKRWQVVCGQARKSWLFLFVRTNTRAKWVRVELVQSPNCVIWICPDTPGTVDDTCYQFDPTKTTFPPYMLDTIGECRFARNRDDFFNTDNKKTCPK